jgi:hypothetical protein
MAVRTFLAWSSAPRTATAIQAAATVIAIVILEIAFTAKHVESSLWTYEAFAFFILATTVICLVRSPGAVVYRDRIRIRKFIGSIVVPRGEIRTFEFHPVTKLWGAPSDSGNRVPQMVLKQPSDDGSYFVPQFWSQQLFGAMSPTEVQRESAWLDAWLRQNVGAIGELAQSRTLARSQAR